MYKIKGDEPAMPCIESINHSGNIIEIRTSDAGLTIRQQFAAMAMQGLLAGFPNYMPDTGEIIPAAVKMADALIYELNKS